MASIAIYVLLNSCGIFARGPKNPYKSTIVSIFIPSFQQRLASTLQKRIPIIKKNVEFLNLDEFQNPYQAGKELI
jgi:hypothetical protein